MSGGAGAPSPHRGRWCETLAVWLVVFAVGWNYLADARRLGGGAVTSHEPSGYYGLLTEALVSGQLQLKIAVDPKLLRLANPYAGPQGADRPHDMSFYRGRFYLYYGITPALILYVPWRLLTGTYLAEGFGTALFCFGGFALGAWWLLGLKRRLWPNVATPWTVLAVAVIGFGSPAFFQSGHNTFYAVPISAAFFCLMLALAALDRAVRAARTEAGAAWLAAASLAHGLAVGARPDYVLGLPLLLAPAVWQWTRLPAEERWRWRGWRVWLAAILPAAAVGCGLALYNYLRFDNPFDFGIQYSMATADLRGARLMGPEFIGKNLRLYLFNPAAYIRYYPFFFGSDRAFGVLPHLTLVAAALFFPFTLLRVALRRDAAWLVGGLFLLGTAVANLATLSLFFGGEDRYLLDFAPPALLLACGVLFAAIDANHDRPVGARLATAFAWGLAAVWTLFNGTAFALSHRPATDFRTTLEWTTNTLVYGVERLAGIEHGAIELDVKFPTSQVGRREPILSTGGLRGTGDILYVLYPDAEHIQFGFFHLGSGGPLSDPIPLDYAREHKLVVQLGSLYPPRRHPVFRHWSDAQVAAQQRQLLVTLDGQIALQAAVDLYFATPDGIWIGRNALASDVSSPRFTGSILHQKRLGLPAPPAALYGESGPLRLKLRFPRERTGGAGQPLISTGVPGAGDLLAVKYLPDGRMRFVLDNSGSGKIETSAVPVDGNVDHVLDVELGSLYPPALTGRAPAELTDLHQRYVLMLDGQQLIDAGRFFHPSNSDQVEIGFNVVRSSAAEPMFTGTILATERLAASLPRAQAAEWGPIRINVRFPEGYRDVAEPLVVTGRAGAADLLFVQYVDERHIRFGIDHWGVGGMLGEPVEINYQQPHQLELTLGSLYPASDSPAWQGRDLGEVARRKTRAEIRLDGRVVFSTDRFPAFRNERAEISVGENRIGASSCREHFNGEILSRENVPW